ncbi:biotin transporter BioY [Clostridium sediminicola]|uniref:biotin transporter BioY n=1 Tax=Clostridium sediminicola TaxID=3114879 RepID=UPI0031F1CCA5
MKINTKDMILVAMFAALTAVGAFLKIPVEPAAITLQFLFTAFAGIILGSKLGALSQIVYVATGLIGIPIFTKGGGIGYVMQPSFGYLIGFIVGAYVIGKIVENSDNPNYFTFLIASIAGLFVIYLIGVPYLYVILTKVVGMELSIGGALKIGLVVFLPGDILKCLITAIVGVNVIPRLKKAKVLEAR